MRLSLAHWRPTHLLAAWCTYWLGLAAVTLTPAVIAIIRAVAGNRPPNVSSVSASFGGSSLSLTVTRAGVETFTTSVHLLPLVLWVGIPPLILYAAWLRARPARRAAPAEPVLR